MKDNFKVIVYKICSCNHISNDVAIEAVRCLCDSDNYTHLRLDRHDTDTSLFWVFDWSTTPQGHEFWKYIYDRIG